MEDRGTTWFWQPLSATWSATAPKTHWLSSPEKTLNWRKKMTNSSEKLGNLAIALNKAQAEIRGAVKDSANPFFKSKYADLESVIDSCREQLGKYGLSYVQFGRIDGMPGTPVLVTRLMHTSGEWVEGGIPIVCSKPNDPQALGSAITYNRRYGLAAMLGIPQIDDDAETAMDRGAKTDALKAKLASVPSAPEAKTMPKPPGDFF